MEPECVGIGKTSYERYPGFALPLRVVALKRNRPPFKQFAGNSAARANVTRRENHFLTLPKTALHPRCWGIVPMRSQRHSFGADDWNDNFFIAGSERDLKKGTWLCSAERPYRGWVHSIQGDMEYFQTLGCPGPNANEPCWLCDCDREANPFNDFVKEIGLPKTLRSPLPPPILRAPAPNYNHSHGHVKM